MTGFMDCCPDRDLEEDGDDWFVCGSCGVRWSPERAKRVLEDLGGGR